MNRRHLAKEWKIQPEKWLSPELEKHEIMLGSLSLLVTGTYSSILACYIANGNPSMIYYKFDEYGWTWFILQFAVIFLFQVFKIKKYQTTAIYFNTIIFAGLFYVYNAQDVPHPILVQKFPQITSQIQTTDSLFSHSHSSS